MATISKKEVKEVKEYLLGGGKYVNESANYFIAIRKDGGRIFELNGKYKFFKNIDAFVRATVRTIKRGY
jgi:hypothetical protein